MGKHLVYLARSRMHRGRANLIQTLHTCSAFSAHGLHVDLYLPPWRTAVDLSEVVPSLHALSQLNLISSELLHPRWGFWPFVRMHKRILQQADYVYTRVPAISRQLIRANIRHVLEVHDVQSLADKQWLDEIVSAHRAGVVLLLVPISDGASERLLQAGAVAKRLHVGRSGYDAGLFKSIGEFSGFKHSLPNVYHLGRLSEDRGLAIFRHLVAARQINLTVVGPDRADIAGVKNVASVPHRSVAAFYERSDLVLLPYQRQIGTAATMSPVKLFEAMAAGRPIIASDLPTIREVLQHESNALLVSPDDPAAWSEAVSRLVRETELAQALAAKAHADAQQYSWYERARGIVQAMDQSG